MKCVFLLTYSASLFMDTYYTDQLSRFGKIAEGSKELAVAFFKYYKLVFKDGALTAREKSLGRREPES